MYEPSYAKSKKKRKEKRIHTKHTYAIRNHALKADLHAYKHIPGGFRGFAPGSVPVPAPVPIPIPPP